MSYLLDLSGEWAATRDASSFDRPNVRSMKVSHVNDGRGQAKCSGAPLDESLKRPLAEVPAQSRCRRRACARHWPQARPSEVVSSTEQEDTGE